MTLKEKAELFYKGKEFTAKKESIVRETIETMFWVMKDLNMSVAHCDYFYIAIRKISGGKDYGASFHFGGKHTLSRLRALGKLYGFTVTNQGYFIATKRVVAVGGEVYRKGEILGRDVIFIHLGGKK